MLLDGFLGALLGGAVTAGAVVASLRHERSKERRGRVVDAAALVMAQSQRLAIALQVSGDDGPGNGRLFTDLLQSCYLLQAHAMTLRRSILPEVLAIITLRLSATGRSIIDDASAKAAMPEQQLLLQLLAAVPGRWIANPRLFHRRRPRTLWCKKQEPALVVEQLSAKAKVA